MSIRQAISGALWAAILVIALQFVPNPAYAHAGHAHHVGEVTAAAHQHGAGMVDQKAAPRPAQHASQPASLSATPDRSENSEYPGTCTGGCCGAGTGCCGAVLVGSAAELPEIGNALRRAAPVVDRRSGIDPDGLARPPRTLAL